MTGADTRRSRAGLAAAVGLALAIRLAYLGSVGDVMHGDEAVTGLMALRMARAGELPLTFWGAHYTGTLQSWLAALVFLVAEPAPFALRTVTLPFALLAVLATGATAARLWGRGAAAATCLAVGTPLLLYYTAQAIGAYAEALAASALLLWLAASLGLDEAAGARRGRWLALGAAGGFGAYSSGLVAPILAAVLVVLRRRGAIARDRALAAGVGFVVGFLPFIVYNTAHPGASFLRLGGRVLGISRADVAVADPGAFGARVATALATYAGQLASFPLRLVEGAPRIVGLSDGLLAGTIVIAAGLVAIVAARRLARHGPGRATPARAREAAGLGRALIVTATLATLVFVAALNLDHPRHLIVLYPVGALAVAAAWASARAVAIPVVALLVGLNAVALVRGPELPDVSVRSLRDWLDARGVTAVYTDYGIAYPLVFLSGERIMASPAAGPVNVERRPAYTDAVARSSRPPAFVFRRGTPASAAFVSELARAGVGFERAAVGDFDVYLPAARIDPNRLVLPRIHAPAF